MSETKPMMSLSEIRLPKEDLNNYITNGHANMRWENSQKSSTLQKELKANWVMLRRKKWLSPEKNPPCTGYPIIPSGQLCDHIIYTVSIIQTERVLFIYYLIYRAKKKRP